MRRLALLLVAALALAACGGDDGDTATDDTASGETTAADTAPDDGATTTTGAPAPEEVAAAPSAGCGTAAVVPAGETDETVTSSGRDRAYHQHVPSAHDGETPVPVVVDYHGYSEGGPIHVLHTQLGAYGEQEGFVTISPDSGYEVPSWNVGLDSEDVAMFGDVVDQVEQDLCVDTNRIFVTGLSNGAFMTSALACAYSDRIAAAAPVAGIRDIDGCAFGRPVPVITFHGTEDTFIDFEGGLGSSVADLPSPDGEGTLGEMPDAEEAEAEAERGPTIPEVTAAWAERNGCEAEATEESVAADVTLQTFPCPAGAETELYVVEGGGHTWPGSEFDESIVNIVGPVTQNIDANQLMWEFFQDHPLTD